MSSGWATLFYSQKIRFDLILFLTLKKILYTPTKHCRYTPLRSTESTKKLSRRDAE
jgi:hypothetical protein